MLKSEKIKSVALAVIKLHLPEGRQAGSTKFYFIIFFNFTIIYWRHLGLVLKAVLGLVIVVIII